MTNKSDGAPPKSCPQHPDPVGGSAKWPREQIEITREEKFWSSRTFLTHVRDFARARQAAPWPTLLVVLARADTATEPNIVLPALVGSYKSLNLFVALVGVSGGGKGASEGAGSDAVEFVNGNGDTIEIPELPIGSGEGIARSFQRPDAAGDPVRRVLFNIAEVDTLGALGKRQGATLMPELRKVYSGEQLGFANAGKDTRTAVAAHAYRACVIIGVQPLKAEPLLGDAHGGTPQRILWAKTSDPDALEDPGTPPEPIQVKIKAYSAERVVMVVPDVASTAIRRHRLAVLREEAVDPLDGHRMLTCLKVAAVLAIIDGRTEINEEDWQLADTVMRVSDRTRREVQQAAAEQSRKANKARALAAAERDEIVGNHNFDRAYKRVLSWVEKGPAVRTELRRKLKVDIRGNFDAAVAELIDRGLIRERKIDGKPVLELVTEGLRDSGTQSPNNAPDLRIAGRDDEDSGRDSSPLGEAIESLESSGGVPQKPASTCGDDARVPESLSPSDETLVPHDRREIVRGYVKSKIEKSNGELVTKTALTHCLSGTTGDRKLLSAVLADLVAEGLLSTGEVPDKTRTTIGYRINPEKRAS